MAQNKESKKKYTFLHPYANYEETEDNGRESKDSRLPKDFVDNLEIDSVYVHSSDLVVPSHSKRPLVKVINSNDPKRYIIRKMRAKHFLKGDKMVFDSVSAKELGIINLDSVFIEQISVRERYTTYLRNHPKEDIRLAYTLFIIGVGIGLVSVLLSIVGLLVSIFAQN